MGSPEALFAPVPLGRAEPQVPPRMTLRSKAILAILGVVIPALLLIGSAMLFRSAVQNHLEAVDQAHALYVDLLKGRLQEPLPQGMVAQPIDDQLRRAESELALHMVEARQYLDGGIVAIAVVAWLGITSIGGLAMLFFSRLALDIGAVRRRALAIVTGERGRGKPLARNDELSDLAQAVDDLAVALARRESDLQIERRQAVHRERLAAIGTMAAGVLREIGNPIAAIDGYARAMVDAQRSGDIPPAPSPWCDPTLIVGETTRLVAITHEISELAAPPATQRQLVSVNEIVAQSLALLRYEPRLEQVVLASTLDAQLPALSAVAERLVLLVTNLVINAADAVSGLPPRSGRITVTTRSSAGGIELIVADNGCGMPDEVRERAFEPLFTTKPPGKGTGLGLPLVRVIAEEHGGRIALQSAPQQGTRVTVWLPLAGDPGAR